MTSSGDTTKTNKISILLLTDIIYYNLLNQYATLSEDTATINKMSIYSL